MLSLFADAAGAAGTATDTLKTTAEGAVKDLQSSFEHVWGQVVAFTPKALAAVVVLVAGYFVAKLVARTITLLCEHAGLQRAAERSGLWESMTHMNIKRTLPAIVGTIVFWMLTLVFLMASFSILDLPKVSEAIDPIVLYIPRVLVAGVIVVIGLLVASFFRGVIATSADRVGVSYAEQLANGCYYVMGLMVFMAAFKHLQLDFDLMNYAILIVFGGLALGFGLALGLGGRDVMAGILAGYYVRQRLQSGDHVTIGQMEGTVREVGPTATIIETDEDGLLNRHSVPNYKMLNEAVR